jgi:hypothetical protein
MLITPQTPPIVLLLSVPPSLVQHCHAAIRATGARGIEVDRSSAATASAAARPHVVLVPALIYAAETARVEGVAHVGGALVMAFHDDDAVQGQLAMLIDLVLSEAIRRRKAGPARTTPPPDEDRLATLATPRAELGRFDPRRDDPPPDPGATHGDSGIVRVRPASRFGT